MPGLYEILNSKTDGAIVRSLDDDTTKFVSSRVHNLSHLESIEIYTTGDNVSLSDVFNAMKNSSEAAPDVKDNSALKGYFEKIYPEIDTDRVYASDMKKMLNWFSVLQKHNIDYAIKNVEEEEGGESNTDDSAADKNVADSLEASEKVVMEVGPDDVPEVAATKTKSRKKKTEK